MSPVAHFPHSPQAPHVRLVVVPLLLADLGAHVVRCADACSRQVESAPEDLSRASPGSEDILRPAQARASRTASTLNNQPPPQEQGAAAAAAASREEEWRRLTCKVPRKMLQGCTLNIPTSTRVLLLLLLLLLPLSFRCLLVLMPGYLLFSTLFVKRAHEAKNDICFWNQMRHIHVCGGLTTCRSWLV